MEETITCACGVEKTLLYIGDEVVSESKCKCRKPVIDWSKLEELLKNKVVLNETNLRSTR